MPPVNDISTFSMDMKKPKVIAIYRVSTEEQANEDRSSTCVMLSEEY